MTSSPPTHAVLTGCSAGGMGVIFNCDWFALATLLATLLALLLATLILALALAPAPTLELEP